MTAAEVVRQEVFEGLELKVIEESGEEWFSAEDIGKALGLEDPRKSVNKIFNRNRDEFEGLYRVVNLTTWLKSGAKLPYRFTTFNPQGAYLLAILARTPKSKALRRWLAKFMAHDLEKLRGHVQALEGQVSELSQELHQARKKLAAKKVKALPVPMAHAKEPEKDICVNFQQLRDLFHFAQGRGYDKLPVNWLHQLLNAQAAAPTVRLQLDIPGKTIHFTGHLAEK